MYIDNSTIYFYKGKQIGAKTLNVRNKIKHQGYKIWKSPTPLGKISIVL